MTKYDWIYLASTPLTLPVLAYRRLRRGKYTESAAGMLGKGEQWADPSSYPGGTVWAHAVSAGEVVAVKAAARELRKAFPDYPLVASTTTETGQDNARRILTEASEIFYFPLDLSWNVRKFLRRFNPRIVTLFEAELWPNFLLESTQADAKVFLLNGRMSERSYRRYLRLKRFLSRPFQTVSAFCMQSQGDAERIAEIVGSDEHVFVTGDCKFDFDFRVLTGAERTAWLAELGLSEDRPVIVAGSTHPSEEEIVLDAFDAARKTHPGAALILAPRHPERFNEAAALLAGRGYAVRRSSQSDESSTAPDVVLLDTMGQLDRAYGLGTIAIVGGSFVPVGGHNLMEAAAHSIPVLYGPHMHRQPDMLRILGAGEGGWQLAPSELGQALRELLGSDGRRAEMGLQARKSLDANRGVAKKMVEIVSRHAADV
jgi:3-deoxy-D-manno-octulosonic-acid transferase